MSRWNLIHSYSPLFKELQLRAWSSPAPRSASRALSTVALWLRPRATRLAFGGAVASAMSALGVAQNCPNPPCFQGLGDLPGGTVYSTALCLSTDGTHVGGGSATSASAPPYNFEAFVWTDAGGMVGIGDLPGNLTAGHTYAFSADGAIAVGWSSSGASTTYPYTEAFRWTQAGGMTGLGDIPGGTTFSQARGISDDGVLVVGHAFPGSTPRAATWSSATGWIAQGAPGTTSNAFVGGSRDGQWACGDDYTSGATLAARWSEFLGWEVIPGTTAPSTGSSVSDNGIVVGYENHSGGNCGAFLWTGSGSSQPLPDLAGGANFAIAEAILRDGSLIVGSGTTGAGPEAVLWDESRSAHRIADVLAGAGVSIPAGWLLTDVQDIVRNGNVITICGNGTNPSGNIEGWIARFDGYPTELFCFGDGTGTACPCANNSPVGNDDGCLNSLGSGGRLRVSGTADLSADTLALLGSQMPNSFALFFQGSTLSGGGNGTLFGDGLRCAGGIIRLGTKQNVGGGSQYPVAGDPSVSVRGLVTAPGGWRYYQTWYRNAAAFCTASTFNLTNAARVFWVN